MDAFSRVKRVRGQACRTTTQPAEMYIVAHGYARGGHSQAHAHVRAHTRTRTTLITDWTNCAPTSNTLNTHTHTQTQMAWQCHRRWSTNLDGDEHLVITLCPLHKRLNCHLCIGCLLSTPLTCAVRVGGEANTPGAFFKRTSWTRNCTVCDDDN
jgi:hypothetical protein